MGYALPSYGYVVGSTPDLWILDVEIHHLETAHPLEFSDVTVVSQGPLRAAVRAEVKYGQSTISVTVCIFLEHLSERHNNSSCLDLSRRHDRFVLFFCEC